MSKKEELVSRNRFPAPYSLCKRAINNHPTSRHNQREWIKSVMYLRNRPNGSIWLLDKQVRRVS